MTTPPRDWDAATYDKVADPMTRWGAAVLDRLPLRGDERVLDAGCGSGRVTELLVERLPDGSVVALDGSPAMIEQARSRLARFGDRVEYVVADLGRPPAHRRTGRRDPLDRDVPLGPRPRRDVREPGGRPPAGRPPRRPVRRRRQRGVRPARARGGSGDGWLGDAHFETPAATTARLEAAGFVEVECWLTDEPTAFEPGAPFEAYLRTVVLGSHVARLPESERDAFVHQVASALPEARIDYVRLNILARRRPD